MKCNENIPDGLEKYVWMTFLPPQGTFLPVFVLSPAVAWDCFRMFPPGFYFIIIVFTSHGKGLQGWDPKPGSWHNSCLNHNQWGFQIQILQCLVFFSSIFLHSSFRPSDKNPAADFFNSRMIVLQINWHAILCLMILKSERMGMQIALVRYLSERYIGVSEERNLVNPSVQDGMIGSDQRLKIQHLNDGLIFAHFYINFKIPTRFASGVRPETNSRQLA